MKCETIRLDEHTTVDTYICKHTNWLTRKAMLVLPGGGYEFIDEYIEGEAIAQAFIPYGFNSFVLNYTIDRKHPYPHQLIQVSKAVKHIRDNAEEYGIDPEEVYVIGFSAGGHLCGTLGLQWNKQEIYDAIDMPYGYNKPKGTLLIYPVVSGISEYSHKDSFKNLLCTPTPTKEQLESVSLERLVTKDAVPAFLVHGASDELVPVENTLLLANAYSKENIPFEVHIYPKGQHGFGLGNEITAQHERHPQEGIRNWLPNAILWMKTL